MEKSDNTDNIESIERTKKDTDHKHTDDNKISTEKPQKKKKPATERQLNALKKACQSKT